MKDFTEAELRDIFERHCKCRPTDLGRDSHSHDCDTGILSCVQALLYSADDQMRGPALADLRRLYPDRYKSAAPGIEHSTGCFTSQCPVHRDQEHGREAEELRSGIERLICEAWQKVRVADLQKLLEDVDARDSLAHLEARERANGDKLSAAVDRVEVALTNLGAHQDRVTAELAVQALDLGESAKARELMMGIVNRSPKRET